MSSSIWTRCGQRTSRLLAAPWRVVEARHLISTRKLVDSDAEQALLEELVERGKPPIPREPEFRGLHVLLATPFRYPPLRHGSRFGTRAERGLWYGSDTVDTALAETAYYRLVLLAGSEAKLAPLTVELSAYQARVATGRGVDLTREPFSRHRAELASPVDYAAPQLLGREMRAAGVEAFRSFSARDPGGGTNLAVFAPRAFARKTPAGLQGWFCTTTDEVVELKRRDLGAPRVLAFPAAAFRVRGRLPAPAV